MQVVDLHISCGCTQAIKQQKVYPEGQLKLSHINFVILNSHIRVMFKIHQKHVFNALKQKNWKSLYWLFSCKKNVKIKWDLSQNLTFQNLLKNRKLLPDENFGNISAFDKESKKKLLSLISANSFIKNNLYIWLLSWNFLYVWMENFSISKDLHSDKDFLLQ